MNLYSFFKKQANWQPNAVFLKDLKAGRNYTYADLDLWTSFIAEQLITEFSVKPGDRVAVQVEKSPQAFFLYLACLRVGAVYLPLNTAYQVSEVEYFLLDAQPLMFVCDPSRTNEFLAELPVTGAQLTTLSSDGQGELTNGFGASELTRSDFLTIERDSSDLAAILYTSGTTGRSKGAMITHGNLASNALALANAWGFTAEDRLLHSLPIYHVHGLFISMHCVLAVGACVHWSPRFNAQEMVSYLSDATVFMGVPTYYTRLLDQPGLDAGKIAGVRLFVSGSAPLRPETFESFEARTGHRILERYGMTETGINTSNSLLGSRVPGAVGYPLPGVEIRVTGQEGMIEVRGENVFPGYWKQPEKTQAAFTEDGFFKTGDLGQIDENGVLRIVGRAKDLVISGGFNVYPKEIELTLDRIPGIHESAVFGVPHPDFGEAVVAAIVREHSPMGASLREETLVADLRKDMASFKAPKRIFFLDELPRNVMGKVQKNVLRERFCQTFQ